MIKSPKPSRKSDFLGRMVNVMLSVIVPEDHALDHGCVPSELDVASRVYGNALPRSPGDGKWRNHAHWVRARNQYLVRIDHRAKRRHMRRRPEKHT